MTQATELPDTIKSIVSEALGQLGRAALEKRVEQLHEQIKQADQTIVRMSVVRASMIAAVTQIEMHLANTATAKPVGAA